MFNFPCVVETELVGQHDLFKRLVEKPRLVTLVPGLGQLQFVEHTEFHG